MNITRIEDMTIDTFAITPQNRAEYLVCRELLLNPEGHRLVLFSLPANEGMHLKHAMMNYWKDRDDWRCAVVHEFISDLLEQIQKGVGRIDMGKYEEPRILILDDFQHLGGKESTQEFFYNLLKKRLEEKKVTILFSQFSLEQMRCSMRDELVSLLSMGLPE